MYQIIQGNVLIDVQPTNCRCATNNLQYSQWTRIAELDCSPWLQKIAALWLT